MRGVETGRVAGPEQAVTRPRVRDQAALDLESSSRSGAIPVHSELRWPRMRELSAKCSIRWNKDVVILEFSFIKSIVKVLRY